MAGKGRFGRLLRSSMQSLLASAEDPRAAYADPAQRTLGLLAEVRAAEAKLGQMHGRLAARRESAARAHAEQERQARCSLLAGQEALARLAVQRQLTIAKELEQLDRQVTILERDRQALAAAADRIQLQIDALRSREIIAAARHSAASAQVAAGEVLAGIHGAVDDAGAVERIEEATEALESRAEAIDGLLASGALSGSAAAMPRFTSELDEQAIDQRLAQLKQELADVPPANQ
jgi:phage shock protein A